MTLILTIFSIFTIDGVKVKAEESKPYEKLEQEITSIIEENLDTKIDGVIITTLNMNGTTLDISYLEKGEKKTFSFLIDSVNEETKAQIGKWQKEKNKAIEEFIEQKSEEMKERIFSVYFIWTGELLMLFIILPFCAAI